MSYCFIDLIHPDDPFPYYDKEANKEEKEEIAVLLRSAASILPETKYFNEDWGFERRLEIFNHAFVVEMMQTVCRDIHVTVKNYGYTFVAVGYSDESKKWEGFIAKGLDDTVFEEIVESIENGFFDKVIDGDVLYHKNFLTELLQQQRMESNKES